jgi:hypothetical protein
MSLACLFLIAALRAADLWVTWRITPDLRYEMNPLYRRLGWRWTIILNVFACLVAMRWSTLFWAICGMSVLAIVWNVRILTRAR